jgi:superfamily II DNA/RNA helicase
LSFEQQKEYGLSERIWNRVQNLILDEADRLFDGDFVEQTDSFLDLLSGECQTRGLHKAMFSATVPSSVEEMARSVMAVDTVRVTVGLKWGYTGFIRVPAEAED